MSQVVTVSSTRDCIGTRALHAPLQSFALAAAMTAIFSERAFIQAGIDLKLFYLLLLLCLPLFFWVWDFTLPRPYLVMLGFLWLSGLASLTTASNTARGLVTEALGISVCSLFYLLFLRYQHRPIEQVFEIYAATAYWICVAGFPIAAIETLMRDSIQPVRSLLLEPAHLCQVAIPAFFFYASGASSHRRAKLRMAAILAAVLCSESSTGILALLLAGVMLLRRYRRGLLLIPLVLAPLATLLYVTSDHLRLRVEDSLGGLTRGDITGVNISTYTLLSNVYVTRRALEDYPLFGTGLGSYEAMHARYIGALPGVESFIGTMNFDGNAKDANSLLLRIATEFGFTGVAALVFLLVRYRGSRVHPYADISNAALLYLLMKLFREGHYFSPEMYFFVWMYVFSSGRLRQPTLRASRPRRHLQEAQA